MGGLWFRPSGIQNLGEKGLVNTDDLQRLDKGLPDEINDGYRLLYFKRYGEEGEQRVQVI
jgi:hypothetical protein